MPLVYIGINDYMIFAVNKIGNQSMYIRYLNQLLAIVIINLL